MAKNYGEEIASYDLSSDLVYCALKHCHEPQVEIRNIETDTDIAILRRSFSGVCSLAYSHDSTLLASGHEDGTVILWHLSLSESVGAVERIRLSPNSKFIAVASANVLSTSMGIWSAESGRRLYTMNETVPDDPLINFSPDSELVAAVGSMKAPVLVWKVKTGICIRKISIQVPELNWFYKTAISMDNSRIAVILQGVVSIWCIVSGEYLCWTDWPKGLHTSFFSFSKDLELLATRCDGNSLQVWHVQSRQYIQKLRNKHSRSLREAQFSHDSSIISAVDLHDRLLIWRIGTGECIYNGGTTDLFVPGCLEPSTSQILVEAGILTRNGATCTSSSIYRFLSSQRGCEYGYGISRDSQWVTCNGSKFLLLPAQAHPEYFTVSRSTVLIVTEARTWFLLRFHGSVDSWERGLERLSLAEDRIEDTPPS